MDHADPVAALALALAIVLLAAKLGGHVAVRVGQPAVLGELLAGVVLGNVSLLGWQGLDFLKSSAGVDLLARLGVLLLLFEIGLESTVRQMMRVGATASVVAVLGVVVPFGLGWGVSALALPAESSYTHAFIGAALCATSVGITARVLKDLGRSGTREARIILGAAVIDDVLGLLVLAAVGGVIAAANSGGSVSYGALALVIGKAVVFLVGALALGVLLGPRLFRAAAALRPDGVLLAFGLAFCFALAWLASFMGLAPIVGAFAAGLVLEDVHFEKFTSRGESTLALLVAPVSSFLVPVFFVLMAVFFVLMGMRTDLASFAGPGVLLLAVGLTVVAVVGKGASALGVRDRTIDRLSVGVGMVPRGEVGLIFADIGASMTLGGRPVIDAGTFSAVVAMVIGTTMVTPPVLKWSLGRPRPAAPAAK
jgi:Kef-type K+ transport system membrane component KefB